MQLKEVKIGSLTAPDNVFSAPLAGYTNAVFRQMCFDLGAGLVFTEMVSAKGLCYDSAKSRELLTFTKGFAGIKAVQLFGREPYYMEKAACGEDIAPFDLIDINMGCPVPKIFGNGEGCALLEDIPLAQSLVAACKRSGKAVSVKFRIGISGEKLIAEDFAKAMRDAGADMITVHGRTRDKMYSGEVNFEQIAKAKKAVDIPVIANGGIMCAKDADKLMDETGADGVMVARGAMYNPFIFAEICGKKGINRAEIIQKQLKDTFDFYDERFATVYMRKMIAFYIKGAPDASCIRAKLMAAKNQSEIEQILLSVAQFL